MPPSPGVWTRGARAAALPTSLEEQEDRHLSPRPLPASDAWASPLKRKCRTCSDKSFPHITDHQDVGRKEARPAAPRSDPAVDGIPSLSVCTPRETVFTAAAPGTDSFQPEGQENKACSHLGF